jgi:hypothetical protein
MKPIESLDTIGSLDAITGGMRRCTLGQRHAIEQQAGNAANVGMVAGGALGLAVGGMTPVSLATMPAGAVAGAVVGDEIGRLRGQVKHGCRL